LFSDGTTPNIASSSGAPAFAAAGFNLVGDLSAPKNLNLKGGSLAKIGLHALMGGLAAEAAGGDFRTGALAAGVNEALVDSLAQQYAGMDPDKKKGLLVMNSQVIGVLAAAVQGNDDAESLQTGAWVAGNATKYNLRAAGWVNAVWSGSHCSCPTYARARSFS
jgi:filamentous hemagglutinin